MRLTVEHLSFSYGSRSTKAKILEDVSFEAKEGEFVVLLGANGEGKTTLFRSILGSVKPEDGLVKIDDKDINTLSYKERAKCIAYIPQESKQVFDYSVKNIVLLGTTPNLSTLNTPTKEDEEKCERVLDTLGILKLKDKSINKISGGERQLVLSARAIVQNAKILLFDEPTASLDYGNAIKMLNIIKKLTESGYTALMSSHNIEQALNYSSRILLLKNKHIIFSGSAEELSKSDIFENFYTIPLKIEKYNNRFIVSEK